MKAALLLALFIMLRPALCLDNAHYYKLQGMRRLDLKITCVTEDYSINERWFGNLIAFYLAEDGFITLSTRSEHEMSVSLTNYNMRDFESIYYKLSTIIRKSGFVIWEMSSCGFCAPKDQQALLQRKLEHHLNHFYYQYLVVNNLKKESRKKIDNYSQWYRSKVYSKKNSHRNWYFPEERKNSSFYEGQ